MLGMGFRGEASSTTIPAPGLGDGRAWGTKAGRAAHREAEVKPGRPRGLASTNQTASMSPPHRRNTAPSAPIVTHAGLRGRRAIATQDMRRLRPATPAPPRTAHVAPIRIVLFILPLLPACPTRLSAGRRSLWPRCQRGLLPPRPHAPWPGTRSSCSAIPPTFCTGRRPSEMSVRWFRRGRTAWPPSATAQHSLLGGPTDPHGSALPRA
jgi:hypothetical protein